MSIAIRPVRATDLPDLVSCANNMNVSRYLSSRFPFPYTEADGAAFLTHAAQFPDEMFAITLDDKYIGGIGTTGTPSHCSCYAAEVGLWVAEEHWGKGVATQAMTMLIEKLKHRFIRLQAYVVEGNEGSKRVLEKCGFVVEGVLRLGHYKDVVGFKDLYLMARVGSPEDFVIECKKGGAV